MLDHTVFLTWDKDGIEMPNPIVVGIRKDQPAKVGTRVHDVPGIDGAALMAAIVRQADEGPGWVEYTIAHPGTGDLQTKLSFVTALDGMYMGCGVYKHQV